MFLREPSPAKNLHRSIRGSLALFFLLSLLSSVVQTAQGQRSVPVVGLLTDRAVVFNAANRKIYAVDSWRGVITVIDTRTQVSTQVRVGDLPVALAVNSTTNKVYVANNGSGSISVLDGQSDAVTATLEIGKAPYVLAVNEVTNRVYVSNTFSDVLSVIDGTSNAIHLVKAGSANKMLVDSERNRVYLLGYEDNYFAIFDGKTEDIRRVPVGALHLWDLALNQVTGEVFVTRLEQNDVFHSGAVLPDSSTIAVGKMPCAVLVDGRRNKMYVANYKDNSVAVVDTGRSLTLTTIAVGARPQAIALDEEANLLYVANTQGSSISVIDGERLKVIATLPTGKNPYALAVDPQNGGLYAADFSKQGVTRVDLSRVRSHAAELSGD